MDHTFRIDSKADGSGRIFVDGDDLSALITGYVLESGTADGHGTVLALQTVPGQALVTGEGRVFQLTDGVPATVLVEGLDPTILERGVNEWMEANGGTVGQAMIGVLSTITEVANKELDEE